MRRAVNRRVVRSKTRSTRRVPRNTVKPNWGLLFSTFCVSALVSCGVTYALNTPLLNVTKISVSGVKLAQADAVQNAAQYAVGKNILLVTKGRAVKAISRISEVADVRMGRKFPNRLWIEVVERKPYAVVTNGKDHFMVSRDGLAFHRVAGPVDGLALLELCAGERLVVGCKPSSQSAHDALDALKSARQQGLTVGKISVDHAGDICLNMDSNFSVKIGQPDEIAKKMSLVRSALDHRPSIAREAAYIDVSCPSAPVWKPKSPIQAAL